VIGVPTASNERRVWLRVGALLDGTGGPPLRDAHIVYDARGILFVGGPNDLPPASALNPAQTTADAVLPEHTLLPGLIEAHAHLFLEGGELDPEKRATYLKQTPEALLAAARTRLAPLVRLGIAAVRDAGDRDGVGLALSRLYRSDDRPLMPYFDSPGAAIHRKGRYGGFMADAVENHPSLRTCVETRIKGGADRIKLIPTGIINFKQGRVTAEPQFTTEEVAELVAAARAHGKQTFAHASGDMGIDRAIDAGVDSIEHGFFLRDDQLAKLRDRGIAWVPTFAPVQAQVDHADMMGWDTTVVSHLRRIVDQHAATLVRAHNLGVQIIAGSDAGSYGVPHGLGFLTELELMERAGMPAGAVLAAATGNSAKRLAFGEKFGRITPGYLSRFVLTRYSPLVTVANLRRDRTIVFDGAVFETQENAKMEGL